MRSLLTILFFFAAFSSFSQNYDYLQAYRRFTLAGRSVKGISNDTAMLVGSADSLVTQYALKGYLAGHGIGIKGRQHQLLGAKADITAELQYLDPLVQGAFVVSDSEINVTAIAPAMYDLRDGQKYVPTTGGVFAKDTSGATYFTDYGIRRFLYNPQTQKTFYVDADSGWSQIGSGNVFNVTVDTTITINNNYVTNDNSTYNTFSDSSFLDARDFYQDGTITTPYRIIRYDNAYIDSLFASIVATGGTVNNYYGSKLPYNGDTSYYLAGDSALHKLPAFTGNTGSLTPLKLTTNGQSGPAELDTATNTLNVPNYFFAAVSDSNNIDYSLSAMTTIYSEKGPGEYLTSGHGITANPDNFNFPFKQLKSLDISGWNAGDYVSFSNSTTANSTAYTFMRAFIRLKQAVPVIQSLSFQFYLNGVAVSKIISMVNYGLDKSMINKYQNISIPMSAFGFTDNNFDEIRLIFGGGSSPDGLYLDLFQFQNATTTENKYVTDVFRIPGTTTVQKVLGGQNSFAFNDSVGIAVDTTSLSNRINLKLNTTDTINKWMPRATPIVNAFNGRAGNVLPQSGDYSAYYEPLIAGGTTAQYWRGDKTWQALTSSVVPEGTNLYYTDTRAMAALSLTNNDDTAATYNNTTGIFNIPKTGKRFGIEDNTSDVDRGINMGGKGLLIDNSSGFQFNGFDGYNGFGVFSGDANSRGSYLYSQSPNGNHPSVQLLVKDGVLSYQTFNDDPSGNLRTYLLPQLSNLPSPTGTWYMPLSVNGQIADATGNINLSGSTGGGSSSSGITSFNSRTGVVVPESGDYSSYYAALSHTHTASQITDFMSAARSAISVTGNGTYNATTGVINITGGTGGEPTITSGTTSQYWRGDKTWQDLNAAARAAISVTGGGTYNATTGVINITGGSGTGWLTSGNSINPASDFLGTTGNNSVRVRTNNLERLVVDSLGNVGIGGSPNGNHLAVVTGSVALTQGAALTVSGQSTFQANVIAQSTANFWSTIVVGNPGAAPNAFSSVDFASSTKAIVIPRLAAPPAGQVLTAINVTNGGAGYTSSPTVGISNGVGNAIATVSGGAVTSVKVNYAHVFTSTPPTITFTGGGGSGASATSTIGVTEGVMYYCTTHHGVEFYNGTSWQLVTSTSVH